MFLKIYLITYVTKEHSIKFKTSMLLLYLSHLKNIIVNTFDRNPVDVNLRNNMIAPHSMFRE